MSEARLWNTRSLAGFYDPLPRHPAALKSLEEIFRQSRGEGNPLLFDLQVFLHSVQVFASLTRKHTFCHHSFQVHFHFPSFSECIFMSCGFVWKTKAVSIFLFTMEKDILLFSASVLYLLQVKSWSITSETSRSSTQSFGFYLCVKTKARLIAIFLKITRK